MAHTLNKKSFSAEVFVSVVNKVQQFTNIEKFHEYVQEMLVLKSRVNISTPVRQERRKIVSGCPLQTEQNSYASYEDDNKYNYNYDDRCNKDVKTNSSII